MLAVAGGGPAPRAAYAEVSAAAHALALGRTRVATLAPVQLAAAAAPRQQVSVGRSSSRADVVAAPLYLTNCSLLL